MRTPDPNIEIAIKAIKMRALSWSATMKDIKALTRFAKLYPQLSKDVLKILIIVERTKR